MKDKIFNTIFVSVASVFTVAQTNEVFQLISLILTCLSVLVIMAFNIWKWYKQAKADGKITKDEIKEAIDIIEESAVEVVDHINDYQERKHNE